MVLDINLFRTEKGGDPDIVRDSQARRAPKPTSAELDKSEAITKRGKKADKDELAFAADVIKRLEKHNTAQRWVDEVIDADESYRKAQFTLEQMKKEFNAANKSIGQLMKAKKFAEAGPMKEVTKKLKVDMPAQEKAAGEQLKLRDSTLHRIGNLVHHDVPVHHDEDFNKVVHEHLIAERRNTAEAPEEGMLSHVDLFARFEGSDLETGSKVAGGRGYFLKGHGVMLNQALINYGLCYLARLGYEPHQTPFFMRQEMMGLCAQLEQFDEELYKVTGEGDDKYLIATSEQPMCAMHHKTWLDKKELPKRCAGYSTCFRKEAGSHGRDTLGVFRIHQFEKVEQFVITSPEGNASWDEFHQMSKVSGQFYESLGLPFIVVDIVSGELNNAAARKHDLEAWFPASRTYRELVSCSNCLDYQARRLECRLMGSAGGAAGEREASFVHMLNSTLCATERAMCCIVENYQTADGIRVPEVLVPFMGGIDFIPFTKTLEEVMPKPTPAKAKGGKKKGGGKKK